MKSKLLCTLLCLAFCWAQGQEIEWDKSFGDEGFVWKKPLGKGNMLYEAAEASIELENGQMLACISSAASNNYLLRLNKDGTVDNTFGKEGAYGQFRLRFTQFFRAPDGKILFTGLDHSSNERQFLIYRLHSNGIIDSSFGNNGAVSLDVASRSAIPMNIDFQANGKVIVLAGTPFNHFPKDKTILYGLDVNGNADALFANQGVFEVPVATDEMPIGMALVDKRLVVGFVNSNNKTVSVAGYTLKGGLDLNFGTNGWKSPVMFSANNASYMAKKPDGSIIIGTTTTSSEPLDKLNFTLCQLKPNGKIDSTFNKTGFSTALQAFDYSNIGNLLVDKSGNVFAICSGNFGLFDCRVTKFTPQGALDPNYGTHGITSVDFGRGFAEFRNAALLADGKVGLCGRLNDYTNVFYVLAKLDNSGRGDVIFGNNGIVKSFTPAAAAGFSGLKPISDGSIWSFFRSVGAIVEQGFMHLTVEKADNLVHETSTIYDTTVNGGIIVVETELDANNVPTNRIVLRRYSRDGLPEVSFGDSGKKQVPLLDRCSVRMIRTLSDGKMLLLTSTLDVGNVYFIARLNRDGTLDRSFGTNGYVLLTNDRKLSATGLSVFPDGRILLSGFVHSENNAETPAYFMRLLPNGMRDQNFGNNGSSIFSLGTSNMVTNVIPQPNGSFIALINYNPEATKFISTYMAFDEKGQQRTDFNIDSTLDMTAVKRTVLANGNILDVSVGKGAQLSKLKITVRHANGAIDQTFGTNGSIYLQTPVPITTLGEMAQSNKKIFISGSHTADFVSTAFLAAFQLKQSNPVVSSLTLINSTSDKDIRTLADSTIINLAEIKGKSINIRANTEGKVGSVLMKLSGAQQREQLESISLYALYGNTGNNYKHWRPATGSYTLASTPYTEAKGKGEKGASHIVNFKVIDSLTLSGLTLINAKTNKPIGPVRDGMVIDLAKTPYINIRANAGVGITESVRFGVNETISYSVESVLPFALAADNKGEYYSWQVTPGTYTITATPYSQNSAVGKPGHPVTLTIKIIHTGVQAPAIVQSQMKMPKTSLSAGLSISAYPNPATVEASVQYQVAKTTTVSIILVDLKGSTMKQVYRGHAVGGVDNRIILPLGRLLPGVYFIKLSTAGGETATHKIVKM
jgi:uncharacterized delta-60 repeat protein